MKRLICVLLAAALLLALASCGTNAGDPVAFYYLRGPEDYVYGAQDGVIVMEERAVSGHGEDLNYLLQLYLDGPLDSSLTSPFPQGSQPVRIELSGGVLLLEMNRDFAALEGLDLTLACACLSSTLFSLTDAEQVTITSATSQGEPRSITLTRDSLTLLDDSIPETVPAETNEE